MYAVRHHFDAEDSEAMLLVDAFNSLNRKNALINIRSICPPIATVLTNVYHESSELFIGSNTLLSEEGTTQGDPMAMPFYALATIPLIDALRCDSSSLKQIWYADDATAVGKVSELKRWWERLCALEPSFGYHVNAAKTWLVCSEGCVETAAKTFAETNVNITAEGRPILGAPIGHPTYVTSNINDKVQAWVEEVRMLAKFADSQPHAAFTA